MSFGKASFEFNFSKYINRMYLTPAELTLEIAVVSLINVFVVYKAAFGYSLDWRGMVGVIVIASILTASLNDLVLSSVEMTKTDVNTVIRESTGIMIVSSVSSLAILVILAYRFSFLMALGLTFFSGLLIILVRFLTAKL